jgi:hypothetical protein
LKLQTDSIYFPLRKLFVVEGKVINWFAALSNMFEILL